MLIIRTTAAIPMRGWRLSTLTPRSSSDRKEKPGAVVSTIGRVPRASLTAKEPIAAPDRTKVIRTAEGKSLSFEIEVSAITKRGEKSKDLPLEPNDVIFVPQSFF